MSDHELLVRISVKIDLILLMVVLACLSYGFGCVAELVEKYWLKDSDNSEPKK